jgi:hypothetical protein
VLVEHGNTALAAQAPEHEAAAAAVTTARERFERAWAMFVLAGWGLNEALVAESRQAQKLIATAMESVCDDEERGRLRHGAKDRVPLHLDDGGAVDEWRDRPSAMLFEGADAANNPKSHALYSTWASSCEPAASAVMAACGKYVRVALERAAANTTRTRKAR